MRRLQIRPSAYRGQVGFTLSGKDGQNRRVCIFDPSRDYLEALREGIKEGRSIHEVHEEYASKNLENKG